MKKFVIGCLLLILSFNSFAESNADLDIRSFEIPELELSVELSESSLKFEQPVLTIDYHVDHVETYGIDTSDPQIEMIALPTEADIRCVQQNIYYEARNQGPRGMQAVAEVTRNRMNDPRYPDSACGVVRQKRGGVCQFSWVCDARIKGEPRLHIEDELRAWEEAERIARKVLDGTIRERVVGNATHYHATYVNPAWARRIVRIARIGSHIFYHESLRN